MFSRSVYVSYSPQNNHIRAQHIVTGKRNTSKHLIGRYHNAKRSRKHSSDSRQGGYDVAIGCPAHVHPQRVSAQRTESLERHVEAAGTIWRAQRSQRTVGRPSTKREVGCWSLETGEWAGWDGMMRFVRERDAAACHFFSSLAMPCRDRGVQC